MQVRYDSEVDAAYVKLRAAKGRIRSRQIDRQRILDYDENDALVGVEFLFVRDGVRIDDLPEAETIERLLRSLPQPTSA